jgi:hypothetical protein
MILGGAAVGWVPSVVFVANKMDILVFGTSATVGCTAGFAVGSVSAVAYEMA